MTATAGSHAKVTVQVFTRQELLRRMAVLEAELEAIQTARYEEDVLDDLAQVRYLLGDTPRRGPL